MLITLGQIVRNRTLGPAWHGVVVAVMRAVYFLYLNRDAMPRERYREWDHYYPGWDREDVLVCLLPEPVPAFRPDECPSDVDPNDYLTNVLAIPVADAIFIEDERPMTTVK